MDDSCAREEWGWNPKYDLTTMTEEMLRAIKKKHELGLI
jgi:nucleoside-diphosphate-sugar epimerase